MGGQGCVSHELGDKSNEHLACFLASFNDKLEYNYISCNFRMYYFDKCKIVTVNINVL